MRASVFLAIWCLLTAVVAIVALAWRRRLRSAERLFGDGELLVPETPRQSNRLERWLFLAGYREASASAVFVVSTLAFALLGALLAWGITHSGLVVAAVQAASLIPGGIADLAVPIIQGIPWMLLLMFSVAPTAVVRGARRRRVDSIDKELPLALEILATLSEAGLGFDAAIARLVDAHPDPSPLYEELRLYQTELLAGTSRVEALRALKRRVDMASVTVFISSLVQSEEIGSALTDVLRRQSEDSHARNRERALIKAESLPTKLVFPLVICYMPGLFVTTIGPMILQFLKLADALARRRG
jgi:tight adherence protein C